MSIVKLENVSMRYKTGFNPFKKSSKLAIDNLSLDIREGQNFGVIGGNGAGKSTLLKLLSGVYKADKGTFFRKEDIRIALFGLQSGFISYLSGEQNIRLTGLLMGMSRREIDAKMHKIVEYTELGDAIKKPVYSYSTGMRSRLAFSVSIFSEPDLLLIDEAMGAGDKAFRKKSSATLKAMINGESAVVIVSHEIRYLANICDQIVWLENGGIKRIGLAHEMLEDYEKR